MIRVHVMLVQKLTIGTVTAVLFTGQMPSLLPNQQRLSIESKH